MAMTAYLDESGTHGTESPVVILTCAIATTAQWAAYETEFAELLAEFGAKTFHAKKLRGSKGDFKGWPVKKKALFNSRFLQLNDRYLSAGFVIELSKSDYDEIYRSGHFPPRARPDTQYSLCFRAALWRSLIYMQERKQEWPLTVVLEQGHQNCGDALRVYGETRERLSDEFQAILGPIALDSKATCLPIAAADLLAYSAFRMSVGATKHPILDVIAAGPSDPPYIVTNVPMRRIIIGRETLAALRDDLMNHPVRKPVLAGF
jgi:hypothetical protein